MSETTLFSSWMPRLLRLALVLPLVTVTLGAGLTAFAARAGVAILAEEPPRNPSDAAIRRDLPALVAFRQSGADLRRRYELSPRYTEFDARRATPLEAAILSRSTDVVRFVVRAAPPLGVEREKATCLAIDVGSDEASVSTLLDGTVRRACIAGDSLRELRQPR
jgi:hypothetical protein